MSGAYDNWERLVRATLRREQLRCSAQRSFSDLSLASSSSFNSRADKIDYEMILRSTKHFDGSNRIRKGHTGDLFCGVLDDDTRVVVKKIDISSAENELHYISELEAFGKVSHSRLVPLLGHCSGNMDEKFLVYKYMPNGDLASVIRSKIFLGLDWPTRLKIATGTAEALCYLHHQCTPPLVHRDVQASSILLDNDFEVRLGSFTKVCTQESAKNGIFRSPHLPQGSKQDTSDASKARCAYDVYCFGKLLELITGNRNYRVTAAAASMDYGTWWKMTVIANYCVHGHHLMRCSMKNVLRALKHPRFGSMEDFFDARMIRFFFRGHSCMD